MRVWLSEEGRKKIIKGFPNWAGRRTLVISVLGRLRQEDHTEPGVVVVHACNPSIWEAEIGGLRFPDSISYLVRPSAT